MPGEYDLIARHFAPLAADTPEALALRDDAAALTFSDDTPWVITTDTLVASVHYLPDDPPDSIARKLLRVNLSDLAAMGAHPRYYLLNLALPQADESWLAAFARGLQEDQAEYGIALLGGDTTQTHGPAVLSLTALGDAPHPLHRAGAQPGDILCVSGTIGDATLGLAVLKGELEAVSTENRHTLITRYRIPEPRLALSAAIAAKAHAGTDISDGLVADIQRLCDASNVGATIEVSAIPLSPAAWAVLDQAPNLMERLITGGDDYELLLAIPPDMLEDARTHAQHSKTALTPIGTVTGPPSCTFLLHNGQPMPLKKKGHQHFT